MESKDDIFTIIDNNFQSFSKLQKSIANYIVCSYEKAAFMTAGKLASAAGVSESTVVRFAQEIGYASYPAMRRSLQDVVRHRLTSVQRIEAAQELMTSEDILSQVLTSDMEQIRVTLEEINQADFNTAVSAVVNASNIYIFGLRSSSPLANFMGYYFNLINSNTRVVNESSSLEVFEQILRISKGDVFIAISFPRYSNRTIRAIKYARDCGATVIGITDSNASPVARLSDTTLYARSDMVSFVDTLVAPLSLINALIVAFSARCGKDICENFTRLEHIWDEYGVYDK